MNNNGYTLLGGGFHHHHHLRGDLRPGWCDHVQHHRRAGSECPQEAYTGLTTVSSGTLSITTNGSFTNAIAADPGGTTVVGNAASNAVLITSGTILSYDFNIGTVAGAVGAVYQTGGSVTATHGANSLDFQVGNAVGAYGYYDVAGGTLECERSGRGG